MAEGDNWSARRRLVSAVEDLVDRLRIAKLGASEFHADKIDTLLTKFVRASKQETHKALDDSLRGKDDYELESLSKVLYVSRWDGKRWAQSESPDFNGWGAPVHREDPLNPTDLAEIRALMARVEKERKALNGSVGKPKSISQRFRELLVEEFPEGELTGEQARELYKRARRETGASDPDHVSHDSLRGAVQSAGCVEKGWDRLYTNISKKMILVFDPKGVPLKKETKRSSLEQLAAAKVERERMKEEAAALAHEAWPLVEEFGSLEPWVILRERVAEVSEEEMPDGNRRWEERRRREEAYRAENPRIGRVEEIRRRLTEISATIQTRSFESAMKEAGFERCPGGRYADRSVLGFIPKTGKKD